MEVLHEVYYKTVEELLLLEKENMLQFIKELYSHTEKRELTFAYGLFFVENVSGDLILKEHEDAKWLGKDELLMVQWLPADVF